MSVIDVSAFTPSNQRASLPAALGGRWQRSRPALAAVFKSVGDDDDAADALAAELEVDARSITAAVEGDSASVQVMITQRMRQRFVEPGYSEAEVDALNPQQAAVLIQGSSKAPHPLEGSSSALHVLWRFSRPHTMLGSAVCIPALTLYAAPAGATLPLAMLLGALYALPAALLMNVYITGLNQLLDIDIDRINKPDLPLASGELSPLAGGGIVGAALMLSLGLGWCHPLYSTAALRATLLGSALLGTLYSAPPFRLKRFPLLASFCIIMIRCIRYQAAIAQRRATVQPPFAARRHGLSVPAPLMSSCLHLL